MEKVLVFFLDTYVVFIFRRSGDLGFDFVNKKPSKFFTVTILSLQTQENNRTLIKAICKTLKRKLNPKSKRRRIVRELKGSSTTIEIKKYFYEQVNPVRELRPLTGVLRNGGIKPPFASQGIPPTLSVAFSNRVKNIKFALYCISLNKKRVYPELIKDKPRVYNFISRILIDNIPFEKADARIELIIDKSKAKPEIKDFNNYIRRALEARIDPKVPLDIYHWESHTTPGLQAVDMFAWGIFQKYERSRIEWYKIFKEKVVFDTQYL